jgi:chitinase
MIIQLKTALTALGGKKLVTASPECVCVYQAMGVPDAETGGGYYNYFVPIINLADKYIDYYQPQAYNNWYEFPSGSLEYLQDVYLNWRNLQGMTPWGSKPIPNFAGVAGEKILMGILASKHAGGEAYLFKPEVLEKFKEWLAKEKHVLGGFMMWDSHWD